LFVIIDHFGPEDNSDFIDTLMINKNARVKRCFNRFNWDNACVLFIFIGENNI